MYAVSWASYLPYVSVHSIVVVGAKEVPANMIQRQAETVLNDGSRHFFSRTNIFIYPRAVIEKSIESFFPRIESAHISRASLLATVVTVAVKEREAFAMWCSSVAACYVMDDAGFIFAELPPGVSGGAATPYVFHGSVESANPVGHTFATGHLPGLVALLELLEQAGSGPQGIAVENAQDFQIAFTEGFGVKASFGQDASTLAKNLELLLSSDALRGKAGNIEYIDLRFDNRVYYKLKGEREVAE